MQVFPNQHTDFPAFGNSDSTLDCLTNQGSCVRIESGSACNVGLWRSWERASMAWKRSSVRSRPGPPKLSPVFTQVSYTSALSRICSFRVLVTKLSQTACAQISVQGVFRAGIRIAPYGRANLRREFNKPWEGSDTPAIKESRGPPPLSPGGPNHDGSLLGGALSGRPSLMSTFRVRRARGIFYW